MKNLLNCHCVGLHSFPISIDKHGYLKRIFYADVNHELHLPIKIAIHPHHVDIKITVLDGKLSNFIYVVAENGAIFNKYEWQSEILTRDGCFTYLGYEYLYLKDIHGYTKGESFTMKSNELHTVFVDENKTAVWMVEESEPSFEYIPVNYSPHDLSEWTPEGLYIEVDDVVKQSYIGKYL